MKVQLAVTLAVILVTVPELAAQRGGGGRGGGGAGGGRGAAPPAGGQAPAAARPIVRAAAASTAVQRSVPSTNIPAITNPVAPVIPYGGAARGLGNPAVPTRGAAVVAAGRNDFRRNDRRRDDVIVVGGAYLDPYPYYYSPFYSPFYAPYYPYMMPAPVPGQLPGVYTVPEPVEVVPPDPALYELPAAAGGGGAPIEVFEPRLIITPPDPERVVDPPAVGTSRADVLSRYGQPWGTISTKDKETLYFRSLTVVIEEGRVSQVR